MPTTFKIESDQMFGFSDDDGNPLTSIMARRHDLPAGTEHPAPWEKNCVREFAERVATFEEILSANGIDYVRSLELFEVPSWPESPTKPWSFMTRHYRIYTVSDEDATVICLALPGDVGVRSLGESAV